jgi:hypothetical protein
MVFRLLQLWVFGDRIRASPREGKLLRLHVGACVRVDGRSYKVTRREHVRDRRSVIYCCRGVDEELELTVAARPLPDAGGPRLTVLRKRIDAGSRSSPCGYNPAVELCPDDIEIFG